MPIKKYRQYKDEIIIFFILIIIFLIFFGSSLYIYYHVDKDLGGNLLAETLGIAVIVIIIERILVFKKWYKWKKIESKVMELFVKEIHSFFTDISNTLDMSRVISTKDDSQEEFEKAIQESMFKQIDDLANTKKLTFKNHLIDLKKKGAGRLFEIRYEILNNFQIKYQEYLKPDLLLAIIEIQEQLKSITLNVHLYSSGKSMMDEETYFEVMSDRFLRIIKAIKIIKDHGYLKVWM